jgi:hypothetical protein
VRFECLSLRVIASSRRPPFRANPENGQASIHARLKSHATGGQSMKTDWDASATPPDELDPLASSGWIVLTQGRSTSRWARRERRAWPPARRSHCSFRQPSYPNREVNSRPSTICGHMTK